MDAVETPNINAATAKPDHQPQAVFAPELRAPRRMNYGDAVRILGTFAVVINHVSDMYLGNKTFWTGGKEYPFMLTPTWWVLNVVDAAMRWAVPAYIMLSGALLLDPARAEAPHVFYKKRLARIGVPLVFWTVFFVWFRFHYLTGPGHGPTFPTRVGALFEKVSNFVVGPPQSWTTPHDIWKDVAEGKPYVHLHFIFRIAGLYAFTPMFRIFLRHSSRSMQIAVTVMCLGLAAGNSFVNGLFQDEPSVFMRFIPFIGYYFLGYLLRDTLLSKGRLALCWAGFVASVAILAGLTGVLIHRYGFKWYPSVPLVLYDFMSPIRILMAIFAWLILVTTFHKPWPTDERTRRWIAYWASTTLGLYLVHPFFREILYFRGFDALHPFGNSFTSIWLGIPIVSIMVYVPSLLVTMLIMKTPIVRRIAG